MPRLRAGQIFAEGDMVVFGYGGFYERPKGWGLDLCYFQKAAFSWWRGRRSLLRRIQRAFLAEVESGRLTAAFLPQLIARIERHILHEWHYDRAELMFQAAKTQVPSLARYADFPAFVRMVITNGAFCTPHELEQRVESYIRTVMPDEDMRERIDAQSYLLFGFLLKTVEADMQELLGAQQGSWLFARLMELAPHPPRQAENPQEFLAALFGHPQAREQIAQWHRAYFQQLMQHPKRLWHSLRKLKVTRAGQGKGARRAVLREARRSLPHELQALLGAMDIPVFVATGTDLGYFREFHEPGYLVYRQTGQMHQMTGLGLCVHRSQGRGGIFVTWNAQQPERFCHTLLEECTHFADGPQDRQQLRGAARYSGTAEFHAAFAADYGRYAPWQNSKALGLCGWGVILTQSGMGARKVARLQKRIEAFGATLDFRHYAEQERMAEIFAALPVIERAIGKRLSRRVLPHLFAYYDAHYRHGLRQEMRELN